MTGACQHSLGIRISQRSVAPSKGLLPTQHGHERLSAIVWLHAQARTSTGWAFAMSAAARVNYQELANTARAFAMPAIV